MTYPPGGRLGELLFLGIQRLILFGMRYTSVSLFKSCCEVSHLILSIVYDSASDLWTTIYLLFGLDSSRTSSSTTSIIWSEPGFSSTFSSMDWASLVKKDSSGNHFWSFAWYTNGRQLSYDALLLGYEGLNHGLQNRN